MAVFVATVGQEYENLVNEIEAEDDSVSLFILYSIGTCLVESVGDYMEEILKKKSETVITLTVLVRGIADGV